MSRDCEHRSVRTFFSDPTTGGDGTPLGMWACEDCKLRFYPACETCVDVGHRNIEHPVLLADTPSVEPLVAWDAAVMALEAGDELAGAIAEYLNPANQFTESRLHAVHEALSRYARLSDAVPENAGLPSVEPLDAAWREAMEALPEGLDDRALSVWWDNRKPSGWWAAASHRFSPVRPIPLVVKGYDSPVEALRALAAALLATQASDSPEKTT